MELTNIHPVPALLSVSAVPGYPHGRAGMIVAKATFRDVAGVPTLETQQPAPILVKDTPTPFGDLPRDDTLRADLAFEVILLGQAHAPGGRPTTRMTVALSVGAVRHELQVSGDRAWENGFFSHRPGPAAPFTTMPLTWARAFGGAASVEIDRESFIDVCDARNPLGRGFDPAPHAKGLAAKLKSPKPYPRFDPARHLPNVEHPGQAIHGWDDQPEPACWATVPTTSAIHGQRMPVAPSTPKAGPGLFHRAHPDWVLPRIPQARTTVTVEGATPDGRWSFALPALQIVLDVLAEGREQHVEAVPQLLVLFPEERTFHLVFRGFFSVAPPAGGTRTARLRLADGWSSP